MLKDELRCIAKDKGGTHHMSTDFREYKAAFLEQNDLAHHGIKGMKWGVRRYQNEDGTLTSLGRKRYGTAENFENAMKIKNASKKGTLIAGPIGGAINARRVMKKEGIKLLSKDEIKRLNNKVKNENSKNETVQKEQVDKEVEENQKILDKEIYSASDKKFKSICREYYKDLKKKGDSRANRMSEDQFVDHMMDDGWQDDADDWYLKKYHQRSL